MLVKHLCEPVLSAITHHTIPSVMWLTARVSVIPTHNSPSLLLLPIHSPSPTDPSDSRSCFPLSIPLTLFPFSCLKALISVLQS